MALNRNVVAEQNASLNELVHTPTFLMVAGALPGLFAATSLEHGAVIGGVCASRSLARRSSRAASPALPDGSRAWPWRLCSTRS